MIEYYSLYILIVFNVQHSIPLYKIGLCKNRKCQLEFWEFTWFPLRSKHSGRRMFLFQILRIVFLNSTLLYIYTYVVWYIAAVGVVVFVHFHKRKSHKNVDNFHFETFLFLQFSLLINCSWKFFSYVHLALKRLRFVITMFHCIWITILLYNTNAVFRIIYIHTGIFATKYTYYMCPYSFWL